MKNYLALLINNLKQKGVTPYEQILGSAHNVGIWADLWENNSDVIELFIANELLAYSSDEPYTKEEFESFRYGLLRVREFAQGCCKERTLKVQQELQKQPKK